MGDRKISRSMFLREGSCLALATATRLSGPGRADAAPPALACDTAACKGNTPLAVRPYQLLCLICSFGENDQGPRDERLLDLLARIRMHPDAPITLQANAGGAFAFQNPGRKDDSPEGADFNQKRDLTILQRLDLPPGETLPARILVHRLLKLISDVRGICGYDQVTSDAWRGCAKAQSGFYEKGRARAAQVLFTPRGEAEMQVDKKASVEAMRQAKSVRIRPHIVVCSICQYGSGVKPPYPEDNLPEMLEMVLTDRPDLLLTLVPGADWMICGPCPHRSHEGLCICGQVKAGGLYNELKDLNVLQRLGLAYGTTMKARDLYRLILDKIPDVVGVCALDAQGVGPYSVWRDGCGTDPPKCYQNGRELLMATLT